MTAITLADIDRMTNSHDGSVYSDLYKDVYGVRPRGTLAQFANLEDFDAEYERLVVRLGEQQDEDKIRQDANMVKFATRVMETMELCNCDQRRAVEIIADAEGVTKEEMSFYGLEKLEFELGLKFGAIKQAIFGEF